MDLWIRKYEMLNNLETQCYGEGSVYTMQRKGGRGGDIYTCKVVSDSSNGHQEGDIMKHLMKHLKSKHKERVVCLKDYHWDAFATYLIMEHCKCSLLEADDYEITEEDAAKIIYSLAKGIKAIHSAGVVHGNLKRDNVVLTHDDKVKIGDFSSAAYFDKSPHGRYGKEVDIYNLGVILYELLEQRPAFEGVSDVELNVAISRNDEDYPKRLLKFERTSSMAQELILKMMAVDPKKRIKPKKILKHKWVKLMRKNSSLYKRTVESKEPPFSVGLQRVLNRMSVSRACKRTGCRMFVSRACGCTDCFGSF